ncbi:MAG: GNAT family N-acetyltransferase [Rhizomicrobium sp.]
MIRRAEISDMPALLEIYNHYVVDTHITFDLEPRTFEQRLAWFGAFKPEGRHQCFVVARGVEAIGWASSGHFKERAAYDSSVETSVYLAPGWVGRGIGRRLYEALFAALERADVHRAYGAIAQPNDASVRLHEAMGFRRVGAYQEVGRKFGRFWDVAIYERAMTSRP